MDTGLISFRASGADRGKVKDVLARHFDYERARAFRSVVLWRLSTIVLVVWALSRGAHVLPDRALAVAGLVAAAAAGIVLLFERRARVRLIREVAEIQA
jgi:hypothetical protein